MQPSDTRLTSTSALRCFVMSRVNQIVLFGLWLGLLVGLPFTSAALPVQFDIDNDEIRQALEATLPARRLGALDTTDGAIFWIRRLERDGPEALEPYGYYQARTEPRLNDNGGVSVAVDLGEPILIKDLSIDFTAPVQPSVPFPLKIGDQLNHRQYESGKSAIHGWLLAHGYLDARLTEHRVAVSRTQRTASVRLKWDVGPTYAFGDVSFSGSSLEPKFLQRYLPFSAGDRFSETGLQDFSRQLRGSGYFQSVDIRPRPMKADSSFRVPLEVNLTPVSRSSYEVGFSVGTDRGPGVEAEVKRRRVNTLGHRWEARSEVATRRQFLAGRYELPSARSAERTRLLDLSWVDEQTDSSDRVTSRLGFSLQDRRRGWRRTDAINVLNERYRVGDDPETESTLTIGSVEWFRREASSPINPSHGWRARATIAGASGALLSSTDFARAEVSYKRVDSIGDKSRLLTRGRLGALWTDEFAELPTSLRFYAGGDSSVRGFDFEALGPRDDEGDVLGGEYVAEASVEVDHLFRPNWRLAIFADAGNAFGDGRESPEYAAGLGVRWLSPIGPLRLDFASALSEPGDSIRVHFSAGPDL